MSGGEYEKIELLLKQFYQRHPFWQDSARRQAYKLALEPYAYDDIKTAILKHVRRSNAFPFVGELTAELAAPVEAVEPERDETNDKHEREVIAKYGSWGAYMEKLAGWIKELEEK